MKIAVTGGSGGFGRSLVPYLIEEGHSVVSIDRSLPTISHPGSALLPHYCVADTTDFGEVAASLHGCDAVVHLAAYASPWNHPEAVVYNNNTASSYNVLSAAAMLGIKRVCLASSINAIGGAYSCSPHYNYFPLDEQHPTYAEDPYSLSKWVLEEQAEAFARRYEWMTIASLRFHWLVDSREQAAEYNKAFGQGSIRHLWAYTLFTGANRSCLLSLTADYSGHEVFYIVAPLTVASESSQALARQHYPSTAVRGDLSGNTGFFDCAKAERILGWRHED